MTLGKNMKTLLLCFALLAGPALGQAPTASLVQLIASPEKFDGKSVIIEGVINFEFEGNALYMTKEHWKHSGYSFGIWLDADDRIARGWRWANGVYCVLKGTFKADDRGHMGLWMGSLTDISMIDLRESLSPDEIAKKKKLAQQGGSVEPATRSELDSQGSDKPQPESEGRSQ